MNARLFRLQLKVNGLRDDRGDTGTERRLRTFSRRRTKHIKTGAMVSVLGAMLLTGCASTTPAATPTATVTATPSVKVVTFNPSTSGRRLAARIAARAKPKHAGEKITGVECKNFPDIAVGTHTDCQLRVNGVKRGFLATFTLREGHYVLKTQKLTW